MKMLLAGTPTDCTPATISRMISGEEQHAGAPEGLILIPTMSAGPMNLAQAAGSELSLVSSFMPRSIMTLISGCATRLLAITLAFETSTTRPGIGPGIPTGDGLTCGRPCIAIGGRAGSEVSLVALIAPWK